MLGNLAGAGAGGADSVHQGHAVCVCVCVCAPRDTSLARELLCLQSSFWVLWRCKLFTHCDVHCEEGTRHPCACRLRNYHSQAGAPEDANLRALVLLRAA